MEKKKNSWLMWVLLVFLPPIGIGYMWGTQKDIPTKKKIVLSIIFAIWCIIALIAGTDGNEVENEPQTTKQEATTVTQKKEIKSGTYKIKDMDFLFSDSVRNDKTGRWRLSKIAENVQPEEYAAEYYKKMFVKDNEVHIIINFTLNTTTCINYLGDNTIDVSIYDYVSKEEHDAALMCSGAFLGEYHINVETGKVEEIQ